MGFMNAITSDTSPRVTPRPDELPDAKRDALRAFEVLKDAASSTPQQDVGYVIVAANLDAIERIFIVKKRKEGHSMGVIGTYDLLTRLYDLPDGKYTIVRIFTEELGLTVAFVGKMKESAAELISNVERVVTNGTLGFTAGEGPFSCELARLDDENGLVMVGSSANLTDQGQKFRVEDIEPEMLKQLIW